jgi:tetratricopeptide (TPR) repeat protein
MTHLLKLLIPIVVVPLAVATLWWNYWPEYHRRSLLVQSEKAFATGNLAKADELLNQLTREDRDNRQAHFLYAQVLRRLNRYGEADTHLGRAAQLGLSKEEGLREYGLLWAGYQFDLAKGALERCLKENPHDVEVLQALIKGCEAENRMAEAERYYSLWLEAEPGRAEALVDRARLRMAEGNFLAAEVDLRAVLQKTPGHYRARLLLGHCLLGDARIAEAEPELLACKQMRPDSAEPLIGLAGCATEKNDYEKAHTLLAQALSLDPGSYLALNDMGNLHLLRKRYDLALNIFKEMLRLYPNDKQVHLKLGQIYRKTGKEEEAKIHERRYQELDAAEVRRLKLGRGMR